MNDLKLRTRCSALTQSGEACKNRPMVDSEYCRVHQPAGHNGDHAHIEAEVQSVYAIGEAILEDFTIEDDTIEDDTIEDDTIEDDTIIESNTNAEEAASLEDRIIESAVLDFEAPAPELEETLEESFPEDAAELDTDQRQVIADELDKMIDRVKSLSPEYSPPAFSPQRLLQLIEENLERFSPELRLGILEKLRQTISEDLFDLDTWRGIWYMVNYSLEYQADSLKRRVIGEYETDEWGLDMEVLEAVKPFFDFMYHRYWRVQTSGIENIPETGRALLVVNHSGQLPWDGTMVGLAVMDEHPAHRLVRTLYATWFPTLPFFSALFTRLGQALATEENGTRLLEQDELVAVFPEGYKGVGKLFKERYRLARFGRGGFIRMALKSQAPIIPVSVVGAEETYISLAKSPTLAKLTHFPYFPISPTWPWLGLLGFIPLPTKWFIDFGEPIPMDSYGPAAAGNLVLVSQLTDQVRNVVQEMIYNRLEQRKSILFG